MKETWYEIDWDGKIVPLTVVKETDKQVVCEAEYNDWNGNKQTRTRRRSKDGAFRTEAEAIDKMRRIITNRIAGYEESLRRERLNLEKFNRKYPTTDGAK